MGQAVIDVDLVEIGGTANCRVPAPLPHGDFVEAVGAFVAGKAMVCGGQVIDCFSYNFKARTWEQEEPLDGERKNAASVLVDKNTWWIAGGFGSPYYASSIVYNGTSFSPGPRLPKAQSSFCLAKINSTSIFMAGGITYQSTIQGTAYILDWPSHTWTRLPDLPTAREFPSCSIVGNEVIVVGGFHNSLGYINGSDIFNLDEMLWTKGPDLPYESNKLAFATQATVTNVEGNSFRIYRGYLSTERTDEIIEYTSDTGEFELLEEKMPVARSRHLVIPLPYDDEYC